MTIYEEAMLRRGVGLQTRLHELERALVEGRLAPTEAIECFRTEWPGLKHVCAWCAEQPQSDTKAAILLSKLAGVAGSLGHLAMTVPEQIYWREQAYAAARRAELAHDELGHGAQLAYLHFVSGNVEAAHRLLDELFARNESLVESPGDARLTGADSVQRSVEERQAVRATLLSHRGMFFATTSRDAEALPPLLEAAGYFRAHDLSALSRCLNTLAVVQDHLRKPEEALKTVDEALSLPVPDSKAMALVNRSGYLDALGRAGESFESLKEGQRIATANGEQSAVALALVQLALWHIRHGDAEERAKSVNWLEESLARFDELGDERLRLRVLDNLEKVFLAALESEETSVEQRTEAWRRLASVREQLGQTELEAEATEHYLASAPEDPEVQLEGNIRLGHVFVKLKQPEKALRHHRAALEILSKLRAGGSGKQYEKAEIELFLSMGQALRADGRAEEAVTTYTRAKDLAAAFADNDALWRARGNLALAQVDCARFEEAISGLKDAILRYGAAGAAGGNPDLRLFGHAHFNLAYAYQKQGLFDDARQQAKEAIRFLSLANDQKGIQEINRQVGEWGDGG